MSDEADRSKDNWGKVKRIILTEFRPIGSEWPDMYEKAVTKALRNKHSAAHNGRKTQKEVSSALALTNFETDSKNNDLKHAFQFSVVDDIPISKSRRSSLYSLS